MGTVRSRAGSWCALALALVASPAVVGAAVSPAMAEPGGAQEATVALGLAEAVRMAFENNLEIAVVAYDRQMAGEAVVAATGAFDPVLQIGTPGPASLAVPPSSTGFGPTPGAGGIGFARAEQPTTSQLAGADVIDTEAFSTSIDLSQQLPFGFRYQINYGLTRTDTNSIFNSLNPAYANTLTIGVQQPLLRGLGRAATAVRLRLARRNQEVSVAAFRAQVEAILLAVERAYWELVFAERSLRVQEESLRLAQEQLERSRAQVEVGMLPPVQVTQAQAAVAAREAELIVARNAAESAADRLRALLQAERLPSGWETTLVPTEEPDAGPRPADLPAALATALARRPELAQARAQLAAREAEVEAARNALLPQVDLVAALSFTGIGGDLIRRAGFFGEVIAVEEGGYLDAAEQLFSFDFRTWRVGFNVRVPLRNRAAQGEYARATLAEDRARTEARRVGQQVVLEVRQAVRGLEAAAERIEATRKARELAEEQLRIEQDRFEVGMSTNFQVLEFQEDLSQARIQELRARIDYRLAEAELARATGTLLDRFGIRLR